MNDLDNKHVWEVFKVITGSHSFGGVQEPLTPFNPNYHIVSQELEDEQVRLELSSEKGEAHANLFLNEIYKNNKELLSRVVNSAKLKGLNLAELNNLSIKDL